MANSNTPFGLRPVRYFSGAPYNGAVRTYYVPSSDSTAIFIGDPVKHAGTADSEGVPACARAAAGETICGVVVAMLPDTRDSLLYRAASTARYLFVADDPDLLFEVQEDAVGGALAATSVGQNFDLVTTAGNTYTGLSDYQLDSSTGGTGTAQVRLVEFQRRADNEIGANAKCLVRIVEHFNATATGV